MRTHPCGAPVAIAGPVHRSQCITCQRHEYAAHPYATATAEADPSRGKPVIGQPIPRLTLRQRWSIALQRRHHRGAVA